MKDFVNAIKRINTFSPNLMKICSIKCLLQAIIPYTNIFLLSTLILSFDRDYNFRNFIIVFTVVINFIIGFLLKYLNDIYNKKNTILHNQEYITISEKLLETEIENIESNEIYNYILKFKDSVERYYSVYSRLVWIFGELLYGIVLTLFSICIILPLFIHKNSLNSSFITTNLFSLLIVISVIFSTLIIFLISKKLSQKWNKFSDENVKLNSLFNYFMDLIIDHKSGKEIRCYECSDFIQNYATEKLVDDGIRLQKQIAQKSAITSSYIAIIGAIIGFGIYIFIGLRCLIGLFDASKLILYISSFMQAINGITKIATSSGKVFETIKLTINFEKILSLSNKNEDGEIDEISYENLTIEFRNVSFKYPNSDDFALKNINFCINDSEKIAIVGENGSGKTTIVKLLCRLYEPTSGSILINNINIENLKKDYLVNLFSVVFQDFTIFPITVAQNIAASDSYDDSFLAISMEKANVKERIDRMKLKEKTALLKDINRNGNEISMGEAQKIALARALYKNSPIMILDEPSSSLDPIAEKKLFESFNEISKEKITIFISHKLSSCIFCDKILVLNNGEVIEEGKHIELLDKTDGLYNKMWKTQSQYYLE